MPLVDKKKLSECQSKYYQRNKADISAKKAIKYGRQKLILPRSGLEFKTKKELKEYVMCITDELTQGQIKEEHKHYKFCCDMLERHPCKSNEFQEPYAFKFKTYHNKSPPRVTLFRSEKFRPYYKMHKNDLDWQLYSMNKCISQKKTTDRTATAWAFRCEIKDQILAVIEDKSDLPCEMCKKNSYDRYEIDHVDPSFIQIMDRFVEENHITELETHKEGIHFRLSDDNVREKWREYHLENAVLQKLCLECHRKKTRGDK